MEVVNVIPNFKAVYNPFTRELYVRYGNAIIKHIFQEIDEWVCIPFNGDEEHPNYLHIQLDFNERLELLCYPRINGNDNLFESLGSYSYYGIEGKKNSPNIKFVISKDKLKKGLIRLDVDGGNWYKTTETGLELIDRGI